MTMRIRAWLALVEKAYWTSGTGVGCLGQLEVVGLLLPFVAFPDKVKGQNVVFKVDNLAVMYGWYKGYMKNDKLASEVLKAVYYLSGMLGTTVNMEHVGCPLRWQSLRTSCSEEWTAVLSCQERL